MGNEIDLLTNYPKTNRSVDNRRAKKSPEDQIIARNFSKEFFDGDRSTGYGGYTYNPRFWQPVVPTIQDYYRLNSLSKVLDVGCAKGFLLYDLTLLINGINVNGIDISNYAVAHAQKAIRKQLQVGNATNLPFPDSEFDLVISINTIHNLSKDGCLQALREIQRTSKGNSFVTVDAYRNNVEKERIEAWNLTARTICHVDAWREIFSTAGYTGDYYWFFP